MGKTYAKFRPTYPQAFIEYLCTDVGITNNSVIADIGSGTGILTKQLLELGNRVIAVEPNDDMRAVAESDLCGYENFVSENGSAENTTLDSQTVDFITVAQAFHWFDRELFKAECRRILGLNGKVILVWNSRIFGTEVVEDGDKINKKYCPHFKGFSGSMRGELYDATGVENTNAFNDFFVGEYDVKVFENNQTLDLNGFIGRNLSASYAPKESDENYSAYIAELTECFNRHAINGKLIMPNDTRSYVGAV